MGFVLGVCGSLSVFNFGGVHICYDDFTAWVLSYLLIEHTVCIELSNE